MKISFFTDTTFPSINGVSACIDLYSRTLAERGHEIIIFAPKPKSGEDVVVGHKNISIVLLPSVKALFYPEVRIGAPTPRSFLKLRKFNPDIVHVHSNFLIGGEGVLGAKLLNIPLIYSFHTYFMEPEGLKVINLNKNTKVIEKGLWHFAKEFCKGADAVICPTKFVEKDLRAQGFKNLIQVIPTGIDVNIDQSRNNKILKKKYDLHGKIILGVGRLSREKNWETLLSAFHNLYQKGFRYTLVLIGSGPAEEELRFFTRVLGVEHRVRFLGKFDHDRLINEKIYTIGDVFVMPSTFETLGVVTLEAMSFGLPVVGVRSRGTTELVKGCGILVGNDEKDMARGISKVLENESLSRDLSIKSLEKAKMFDSKKLTERLEKIYLRVVNNEA